MTNPFKKPQWSNQKVSAFARFLAWIILFLGILSIGAYVYHLFKDGAELSKEFLFVTGMMIPLIYFVLLMSHVAVKGRAPEGWLPWK